MLDTEWDTVVVPNNFWVDSHLIHSPGWVPHYYMVGLGNKLVRGCGNHYSRCTKPEQKHGNAYLQIKMPGLLHLPIADTIVSQT